MTNDVWWHSRSMSATSGSCASTLRPRPPLSTLYGSSLDSPPASEKNLLTFPKKGFEFGPTINVHIYPMRCDRNNGAPGVPWGNQRAFCSLLKIPTKVEDYKPAQERAENDVFSNLRWENPRFDDENTHAQNRAFCPYRGISCPTFSRVFSRGRFLPAKAGLAAPAGS